MPLSTRNEYAPTRAKVWVAQRALLLLLVTFLSIGVSIATPGVARADDTSVETDTGTLTITPTSGNDGMRYDVYKIFTCDVDLKSGSYTASNVEWPNDGMKNTVLSAIQTYDKTTEASENWAAQDAAEYLAYMIPNNYATRVSANGLAENLVKAVIDQSVTTTITAGEPKELDEGYYLIVSTPSAVGRSMMGTSPIFTMLGNGQTLTITEKTSIPALTKTIVDDSTTEESSYADARIGQSLTFRLKGTLPDSFTTFTSFSYKFSDTLPAGMDLVMAGDDFAESDVVVKVVNGEDESTVSTNCFAATYDTTSKKLEVSFTDLKGTDENPIKDTSDSSIAISDSSKIVVEYKVALNANAVKGTVSGNTNSATLTYSNNPQAIDNTSTSAEATATAYTHGLKLTKVDKQHELDNDAASSTLLKGAKFTIQSKDDGAYLKTDGTFGETALPQTIATDYSNYIFATDSDGTFTAWGLDAGTYIIHEVTPPSRYRALAADLELTLTTEKDASTSKITAAATLSGGEGDGEDSDNDGVADKGTRVAYDSSTGYVVITATNAAIESGVLPLTGLSGITLVYVAGGAILLVSLVVIVGRHLKKKKVAE